MASADPGSGLPVDLPNRPPTRVVSLVPSITESLFVLGFGSSVVGVSDYCTEPAGKLDAIKRVGGPKDARLTDIAALSPDLVIANPEENDRSLVEALRAGSIPVWLTFPRTARQGVEMLWDMVGLYKGDPRATLQVRMLETSLEWAEAAANDIPAWRYFCPIWEGCTDGGTRWWMTFNGDTYSHDLLALFGGVNVFSQRARRYPLEADLNEQASEPVGERDTRYPRVTLEEVIAAQPDVVLLPDEPFSFNEFHRDEMITLMANTPAGMAGRVLLLDGRLITWYGTHLAQSLESLPALLGR